MPLRHPAPSGDLGRLAHGGSELYEEIIGHFLGRAGDQALAELRQFAADLGFDVVLQERPAVLVGQMNRRAALGETRAGGRIV